jgi:hypothetical protein
MMPVFSVYDLLFSILFISLFAFIICGMSAVKYHYSDKITRVINSFKGFIKPKLFNSHKT